MPRQRSASRFGAVYIRVLPRMQKSHRECARRACKRSGTTTALTLSSRGHLPRLVMSEGIASRSLAESSGSGAADLKARRDGGPSIQAHGTCPAGGARWHHAGQHGPEDLACDLYVCLKRQLRQDDPRCQRRFGTHGCRGHTAPRGWWPSVGQCRNIYRPASPGRADGRWRGRMLRLPAQASAEVRRRLVDHHHSAAKD